MPKKQQKMASNKKMQENKPTLKFNFTWEYMWPVLILGIFCSDGQNQRALLPIPSLPCICNWWEHCERLLRYSYNLKIWWSHFLKKYFVVRGGFFLNHVQEVLEYLKSCLSSIICESGYAHIKAGICWAVAHTINIIGVRINYYWPPPPAAKKGCSTPLTRA